MVGEHVQWFHILFYTKDILPDKQTKPWEKRQLKTLPRKEEILQATTKLEMIEEGGEIRVNFWKTCSEVLI